MKKSYIYISMFLIYIFLNINIFAVSTQKIDFELKSNEIALTFVDDNLLISNNYSNDFLILNKKGYDLSKFKTNNLGIILLDENTSVDIEYENKYVLSNDLNVNNVNYNVDNNIVSLKYKDILFCIYIDQTAVVNNSKNCNFLYLYNTSDVKHINVNEKLDIIFLNENASIPNYFLEDIYSKWVDIYDINKNNYLTLKLDDKEYTMLIIPND